MSTSHRSLWKLLEQRSANTFLVAGMLLFGYAVSKVIYTFTNVTAIGAFDVAFGGLGLLATTLGLLGLYPRLRDGAPRLSLAGVVFTLVGAVGTSLVLGWLASATLTRAGYPAIPEEQPAWILAAFFIVFPTISLGFLLLGIAGLRTDALSQAVSRLLLVVGLALMGLIVANVILPSGQYIGVLVYVPASLALLTIGYLLRTESVRTDHVEQAADSFA